MKTLRLLFLTLLPALLVLAAFRPVRSTSHEVRQVAAFTDLRLAGSPNVVLRQGSPQRVELEGDPADLARIETIVSGGKLRIGTKNNSSSNDHNGGLLSNLGINTEARLGPVTVYVTMPAIDGLSVSGSGSIKAAEGIKTNGLSLAISGSGRLELAQVQAATLTTAISGSGSMVVAGTAPQQEIKISGSGGVLATNLRSETCRISISGSGSCRVNATRTLDARIAGSGDVYVTGNPQVTSAIAGSGKVHRS